ncbi:MAG: sigma-70 family RNA polymerase sigma factor [Gammaproteobacteria bacterium]|nr:sigma-70 family RNA polymerase sigma factor [Gammaproteobacteria bacterium]
MTNLALVTNDSPGKEAGIAENREQRFNKMVLLYQADLRRYSYWLAGDRHTAEDLVQEALMRAWRAFDKLEKIESAKGWLLTILRRENARRFERFRPQESDIPLEELKARESGYDTSIEAFVLRRAIEKLPEDYRIPLVKKVVEGYSQKEIAAQIGISSAGVGTRLFRARQKLREALIV